MTERVVKVGKGLSTTTKVIVLIALVVVASVVGVGIYLQHSPQVIVPTGTTFSINWNEYHYFQFTLSSSASITGAFQGSDLVAVSIADPSSFAYVGTSSYFPLFIKFDKTTSGINFNLPAGNYYIVFQRSFGEEANPIQVTITEAITVVR